MKRNRYYAATVKRRNHIKALILTYAVALCTFPRLLIELFFRKNFGERYFSLASVITAMIILLIVPFYQESGRYGQSTTDIILSHFVWFLYAGLLLGFGIKRQIELRHLPKSIDLAYFSMSHGVRESIINRLWTAVLGRLPEEKIMLVYLEPLPFLLLGFLIKSIDPPLGILLISCSVMYSLSYMGEYWIGNNLILDIIDEIILNQETERMLVYGMGAEQTKGCEYIFDKPKDAKARETLADYIVYEDVRGDEAAAVI